MSNTHPNSSRRGFQDLSRALGNVHAELQQIAQEAPATAGADRQIRPYLSEVRDAGVARAVEIYRSRRRRDAAFAQLRCGRLQHARDVERGLAVADQQQAHGLWPWSCVQPFRPTT